VDVGVFPDAAEHDSAPIQFALVHQVAKVLAPHEGNHAALQGAAFARLEEIR
jgi:hypothetical protein